MNILNDTVALFQRYSAENNKAEIVKLLKSFLAADPSLDDMQICWALWNISDNLAMLRLSDEELENHKIFEKRILTMDNKYLHWIVSDCTQKMTLLIGGYEDYWDELYRCACNNSAKNEGNAVIRFESHRANVASATNVDYKFNVEHSYYALNNLKESCDELKNSTNYMFYILTYFTKAIGLNSLIKGSYKPFLEESYNYFTQMIPYLDTPEQHYEDGKQYVLGTFQQLNAPRSKYNQAFCGINNYIIQLVNAGEYKLAIRCNDLISKYSLNYGRYYDSKLKLAKDSVVME